jgi:hypothetical protein
MSSRRSLRRPALRSPLNKELHKQEKETARSLFLYLVKDLSVGRSRRKCRILQTRCSEVFATTLTARDGWGESEAAQEATVTLCDL